MAKDVIQINEYLPVLRKCRICSVKTPVGFNIKFKLVHVCEECATSIFIQQATWYVQNKN